MVFQGFFTGFNIVGKKSYLNQPVQFPRSKAFDCQDFDAFHKFLKQAKDFDAPCFVFQGPMPSP